MTDILICGFLGRMGGTLRDLAEKEPNVRIVCGVDGGLKDAPHANVPVYVSFSEVKEKPDAVIDFSRPSALPELLEFAKKTGCALVLATTGYNVDEMIKIREAAKKAPIFQSANFSLGVNLLAELCKRTAKVLGENYDIEIVEKHHRLKADAPSGTALFLADEINTEFNCQKQYVYGRHGKEEMRGGEIGIHAVRGGTIVGEHDVIFTADDETLTFSHSAQSRKLFAAGALRAAQFMKDKPCGLYKMSDLLDSIL